MPIRLLMLYGALGGLASVLVAALLRPLLPGASLADAVATPLPGWRDVLEAGLHVFAGAGIGLLYWLSWGFAAVVDVRWWVRGLAFGLCCAAALLLPLAGAATLRFKLPPRQLVFFSLEWSYTCAMAGLACAWVAEAAQ